MGQTNDGDNTQINNNINTGGGAYVGGDVYTGGGGFVGGNQTITNAAPLGPPSFPISNLPPANPHFTGRIAPLQTLADTPTGATTISQTISGLGGVGKSQLMLEFAHQHHAAYDIIWWLRVDEALAEDMLNLGRQLHLPVDTLDQPAALQLVRTCSWLNGDKRWLLLCDNADQTEPRTLRAHLPGGRNGRILITSRSQNWHSLGPVLPLDVFSEPEAAAFWDERLGPPGVSNPRLKHKVP